MAEITGDKAVEAKGLLLQDKSFTFILQLVIFDRILSCTNSLTDCFQSKQVDLAKAADLVSTTMSVLKTFRSEEEWIKFLIMLKV